MEQVQKKTEIQAIITYKSGRTETITGKLKSDQKPYKTFEQKIKAFRNFPTVTNIEIVTN